ATDGCGVCGDNGLKPAGPNGDEVAFYSRLLGFGPIEILDPSRLDPKLKRKKDRGVLILMRQKLYGHAPDMKPIRDLEAVLGRKVPRLPEVVLLASGDLTSGNVLLVSMTGADEGSSPWLSGFRLIFDYMDEPSDRDLLEV